MTSAKGWRKRRHWVHRKMVLKLWLFTFFLWEGVAILQSCTHCQMSLMIEKHNLYIYIYKRSTTQPHSRLCFLLLLAFIYIYDFHSISSLKVCLVHISTPIHCLHVHTHGLGVHKAASGACWCRFQTEGPKRGTALLLDRCKYPHTRWCCTSGIGNPPPRISGLRCAVWGSGRSERTGIFCSRLCFTSETLIIHIF